MPSILQSFMSNLSASRLNSDWSVGVILVVAIVTSSLLDVSQLIFVSAGAVAYAIFQGINGEMKHKFEDFPHKLAYSQGESQRGPRVVRNRPAKADAEHQGNNRMKNYTVTHQGLVPATTQFAAKRVKPDIFRASTNPVSAPKFKSTGWDAEVKELVSQLSPSTDEEQSLQRLVAHVKRTIQPLFPNVEVDGFIHSSVTRGTAFGVAVPEVDIVAYVNPELLLPKQRNGQQKKDQQVETQKLHKCAVRNACDRLVSTGGLKFRRSAFRVDEPRVTLMVPNSLGFYTENIPVDFSINSVTPFYTAALLTECGQIEPRAKALIMLVKRWAKDRGICFAAKGHLSPYLWTLLVMYFLQVDLKDLGGPLLPLLDSFKISSCSLKSSSKRQKAIAQGSSSKSSSPRSSVSSENDEKASVAELFCKFMLFYTQSFDWHNEAISIRSGRRAPPALSLPLHIILNEDGSRYAVGPSIEDPFKTGSNLGEGMNKVSLPRLHEELTRAADLCTRGASLTEMLQPWSPPEAPEQISGPKSEASRQTPGPGRPKLSPQQTPEDGQNGTDIKRMLLLMGQE